MDSIRVHHIQMSMVIWIDAGDGERVDDSCVCSEPLDSTGIIHEIKSMVYRKNVMEAYAVEW